MFTSLAYTEVRGLFVINSVFVFASTGAEGHMSCRMGGMYQGTGCGAGVDQIGRQKPPRIQNPAHTSNVAGASLIAALDSPAPLVSVGRGINVRSP